MTPGAEVTPEVRARFMYANPADWQRKTYDRWVQVPSGLSINEFIQWAREQGIDFDQGQPSANFHVKVPHVETDEEFAARIERMEQAEQRHVDFIRKRYAEIRAALGDADGGGERG